MSRARISSTPLLAALALALAVPALASAADTAAASPTAPGASATAPEATASVVNGESAVRGSFPYLAFVSYRGAVGSEACTGTVVASDVILTAAHCVLDEGSGAPYPPAGFRIVTGSVDWETGERVVSTVAAVAVDPEYQSDGERAHWADAALLQLAKPVTAPPVRLATAEAWGPGSAALMAGWGKTAASQTTPASVLQYGSTAVQSAAYCASQANHFDAAGQLCAVDAPAQLHAACNGDSGGPLLVVNPGTASEPLEIGIASYATGEGCSPDSPQYYTRADLVAPWVAGQAAAFAAVPPAAGDATATAALGSSGHGALPRLGGRRALGYARAALSRELGARFDQRRDYQASCEALEAPRRSCAVSWSGGAFRYAGSVTVFYALEAGRVEWRYRLRVRRTPASCASRRCPAFLFRA